MLNLHAEPREAGKNNAGLKALGKIPAVFYGFKKESTSVSVDEKAFRKAWKEAGESTTITLETKEGNLDVLIHEVQVHPVTGAPLHVDFLVIDATKELEVAVPIEFVGESPAVKGSVGTLMKVLHEIEIKALPKNLPHVLEVDISTLANIHDQIHVSDIALPTGVTLITSADEVVISVAEMKEEKEEEAAPVDLSAIEMSVEKGKKEEEAPAEDAKE